MNAALDAVTKPFNSMVGTVSNGYGLFKDFTNLDVRRQVNAQQRLMDYSQEYTRENMESQFNYNRSMQDWAQQYNRENMSTANDYLQHNMQLNHDLNLDSMSAQYAYNQALSNAGRSVLQQRMSGVNPQAASAPSQSVSALGATASSASAPAGPDGSVSALSPSSSAVSIIRNVPNSLYADIRRADSESALNDEKKRSEAIANITRLDESIARLELMQSEILKNHSTSENLDANTIDILESLEYKINKLASESDKLQAEIDRISVQNAVDQQNADTNQRQVEENIRHNKESEAIQRVANSIASRGVAVSEAKVEAEINKLKQEANKFISEQMKNDNESRKVVAETQTINEVREHLVAKLEQDVRNAKEEEDKIVAETILAEVRAGREAEGIIGDILGSFTPPEDIIEIDKEKQWRDPYTGERRRHSWTETKRGPSPWQRFKGALKFGIRRK